MPKTASTATMALSRWRGDQNGHTRTNRENDRQMMAQRLRVLHRLGTQTPFLNLRRLKMTHKMPQVRVVLASTFIVASTLLAGCSSPSSSTTTETSSTMPAPMADQSTTTTTNYRK